MSSTETGAKPGPRRRGLGGQGRGASVRVLPDPSEMRGQGSDAASTGVLKEQGLQPPARIGPSEDGKRKSRSMYLPQRLLDRIAAAGLNRTDVILAGVRRHAGAVYDFSAQRAVDPLGGRKVNIYLSDAEHRRLKEVAEVRRWPVSSTAALLADRCLDELEQPAS